MQLRPRQREFVHACVKALKSRRNTMGIAPTGCGKTVMLSAVAKELGGRTLVLQHRDELVNQNRRTFKAVAPEIQTDIYTADRKRWSDGATFAMVQTLARGDNLDTMPRMDLLVIDEAHHVAASSYRSIIEKAKALNPDISIFGVTATPQRGDRKALVEIFNNVADVINIRELVAGGFLVRPRTFVIDCGLKDALSKVRKTANDFDMAEVEAIMDKEAVTDKVIAEWKRISGDRRTVMFCSTVKHAEHVLEELTKEGVNAGIVTGDMADSTRRGVLASFDKGSIQVLLNVAVLTEGWDCQPVSCVVLLRPCSFKSTMIQMIGRGLRKVDPERYPGIVKDDCHILDFGYSLLTHGDLDVSAHLGPSTQGEAREVEPKTCPECQTELPPNTQECPICGHSFSLPAELGEKDKLENFTLTEVELLDLSPYKWIDLFGGVVTIANAMTAWAVLVNYKGLWVAVVGRDGMVGAQRVAMTKDRIQALSSADDYLREHGDKDAARKTKRWLHEPATDKQLQHLEMSRFDCFGLTKYEAACKLTWKWMENKIRAKVQTI